MTQQQPPGDLSVEQIMASAQQIAQFVGNKWIERKLRQAETQERQSQLTVGNRKHSYLYRREVHPLITWIVEFERWRKACAASGRFELSEAVLRIYALGGSIEWIRNVDEVDRLQPRLRNPDTFLATAFEIEVAASYARRGWTVSFVPERKEQRTPDLHVKTSDGYSFWVECKCRDLLSARDAEIAAAWESLEAGLVRALSPAKRNALVVVKSRSDPARGDVAALSAWLLDHLAAGGIGDLDIASVQYSGVADPSGKYECVIRPLTQPDEEVEGNGVSLPGTDFDRATVLAEVKHDASGRSFVRNPIMLGFKNHLPSDKVSGILSGLKAASGQLPKEGPGVVWIRIPDNAWSDGPDQYAKQAEALLSRELRGNVNRRINAVVLMTRFISRISKDGTEGIAYTPGILTVEHANPRAPSPAHVPPAS